LNGYWKEAGLDVEVLSGGPNNSSERKVTVDPHTLGLSRAETSIIAAERGLPLIVIGNYLQVDPIGVLLHEESPVKTLDDLNGHSLMFKIGSSYFEYLVRRHKLDRSKILPLTGSMTQFIKDPDFIQQGYPTTDFYAVKLAGVKVRWLPIADDEFNPYNVLIAHTQLVAEHPDWVKAFSLAAYRGWAEYLRNPKPVHEYLKKINPEMNDALMDYSFQVSRDLKFFEGDPARGESLGKIDPVRWSKLHDTLLKYKMIKKPVDLKKVYTEAFSPENVGFVKPKP
jgi:NitT/TauT family transport system substrate-binding protein